ncbi:MAG: hypothetical protein SFV18_17880 [Bryobacteraceae bacterium]|nr:hypothetical protein [Bryobacteraceae bacterium]
MQYEKPVIEREVVSGEPGGSMEQAGANAVLVGTTAVAVGTWVVAVTQARFKFKKDWVIQRQYRANLEVVALPPAIDDERPRHKSSGFVQIRRHSGAIR